MSDASRTLPDLVELLEPDQVLVVWADGHESLYPHRWLRERCQCARCVDEWNGQPLLNPAALPIDLRVRRWEATGRYGLNLHFTDGHTSGIYTFERLRDLCPCPECTPGTTREAHP